MSGREWQVRWAPGVLAVIEDRSFDEDGRPEPQRVDLTCRTCGAYALVWCESGQPRRHAALFARAHLHRDPFAASNGA
jgi:hypothetical protein